MFMDQKNQYSDKELYYTKQSIDSCYQQYFFTELNNTQFVWKYRQSLIAKAVLIKKNWVGAINLPDFRLYYKATVSKEVWY